MIKIAGLERILARQWIYGFTREVWSWDQKILTNGAAHLKNYCYNFQSTTIPKDFAWVALLEQSENALRKPGKRRCRFMMKLQISSFTFSEMHRGLTWMNCQQLRKRLFRRT